MKKGLLVAGLTSATILGASLAGGAVLAHSGNGSDNFAEKLATKFNLNKDDVQKFMDENHEARHDEMEAKFTEALDKAVSEGKITAEQKDKIIAHQAETKTKREEIRQMTDETARREAMKALHEANKKWAEDNSIDMKAIGLPRPGGQRDGPRGQQGPGDQ